ncbi:MAG: MFS transporter [Bacteroidales bacterium]
MFNFFSSFGQTFFISLFVPFWIESFRISNTTFGSMYATVTIISAFLLSFLGKYIDQMPLKKYGLIVFIGLVISVLMLSQSHNVAVLMVSLLLVRLFGQGLMTHTSSTGIAKHFDNNRGKALGFTTLGHPTGQFVLPIIILALINFAGWQRGLIYIAVISAILVIPALWAITPVTVFSPDCKPIPGQANKNNTNLFISLKFWIIALNIFIVPFICTAIFLYQYAIGHSKGWDNRWVSFSFAFFPVFSAMALLISGNLVDRFSGIRLFPLYLIPAFAALLIFAIFSYSWVYPALYALLGFSSGLGSTIKTAMQVEVYGKKSLGKIRSYFSTILVLSTALGPPTFGFFIDRLYPFNKIMLIFAGLLFIIIILSFKLLYYNTKLFSINRIKRLILFKKPHYLIVPK